METAVEFDFNFVSSFVIGEGEMSLDFIDLVYSLQLERFDEVSMLELEISR